MKSDKVANLLLFLYECFVYRYIFFYLSVVLTCTLETDLCTTCNFHNQTLKNPSHTNKIQNKKGSIRYWVNLRKYFD